MVFILNLLPSTIWGAVSWLGPYSSCFWCMIYLLRHSCSLIFPSLAQQNISGFDLLVAQKVKNLFAMWETQVQFLGREDPLEKGMATHSSILAWRTPRTEEPGGLQSMGLQRVGHDWTNNTLLPSLHAALLLLSLPLSWLPLWKQRHQSSTSISAGFQSKTLSRAGPQPRERKTCQKGLICLNSRVKSLKNS